MCEINIDQLPLIHAPAEDLAHIPGPDQESDYRLFALWDDAQATELCWSGLSFSFAFLKILFWFFSNFPYFL